MGKEIIEELADQLRKAVEDQNWDKVRDVLYQMEEKIT